MNLQKRMKRTVRGGGIIIDLLLIILILALYIATNEPQTLETIAGFTYTPHYRGNAEDKAAIEFTVDWNASALTDILDTLNEKETTVTFAVSGNWANDNAGLLKRIHDSGHEIAVMGMDSASDGNLSFVVEDVAQAIETVEGITGVAPQYYYSGTRNVTVSKNASAKLGLTQVLSTIDLLCARGNSEDILSRALQNPLEGSIILMQPTAAASEALSRLIDAYEMKGISIVKVSEVLNDRQ